MSPETKLRDLLSQFSVSSLGNKIVFVWQFKPGQNQGERNLVQKVIKEVFDVVSYGTGIYLCVSPALHEIRRHMVWYAGAFRSVAKEDEGFTLSLHGDDKLEERIDLLEETVFDAGETRATNQEILDLKRDVASLRRINLLASERTHGVQLAFEHDTMSLNSVGFDIGTGEEKVECSYQGEAMKVFVNAQYVLDFLGAVGCEYVEMRLRDADGPVVLTPVDDDAEIAECLYVIMPIRL